MGSCDGLRRVALHFVLLAFIAAPQVSAAQVQPARPVIEWVEWPRELPQSLRDSARFGWLTVPQDHADPTGPHLRIAFALLPAGGPDRRPDPVVSIAGGPGMAAISVHMQIRAAGPHPMNAFRAHRDLIIIDPRGHGFSDPAVCRELDRAGTPAGDSAAAERRWLAELEACRRRLQSAGVRLDMVSAVQVAHDLELLRRALGAPQLNLIGLSYGNRIAAETVRQWPASIRSVYYSAPVAAGQYSGASTDAIHEEVLQALIRRCSAQAECNAAYPTLRAQYDSVMTRLRRHPVRLNVALAAGTARRTMVIDDKTMREGLAQLLVSRDLAAGVPLLIRTVDEHGVEPLGAMAARLVTAVESHSDVARGTFHAFRCNDGVLTRASAESLQQRCRALLGDAWRGHAADPVRGDVPAWIETGEFDPRTPPSYARFLAGGMSRAHVVILPAYGHERPPDCSFRMASAFFDAPDTRPDMSCIDSIPPLPFVTGVVSSRRVGGAVMKVTNRPWFAALPAASGLLLLVPAVVIPVRSFRRRRRMQHHAYRGDDVVLLVLDALALTFVIGIGAAIFISTRRHFFIPAIGLPQEWAWLLALPPLLLVLTPVAAVLVLRDRRRDVDAGPSVWRWAVLLGVVVLLAIWYAPT